MGSPGDCLHVYSQVRPLGLLLSIYTADGPPTIFWTSVPYSKGVRVEPPPCEYPSLASNGPCPNGLALERIFHAACASKNARAWRRRPIYIHNVFCSQRNPKQFVSTPRNIFRRWLHPRYLLYRCRVPVVKVLEDPGRQWVQSKSLKGARSLAGIDRPGPLVRRPTRYRIHFIREGLETVFRNTCHSFAEVCRPALVEKTSWPLHVVLLGKTKSPLSVPDFVQLRKFATHPILPLDQSPQRTASSKRLASSRLRRSAGGAVAGGDVLRREHVRLGHHFYASFRRRGPEPSRMLRQERRLRPFRWTRPRALHEHTGKPSTPTGHVNPGRTIHQESDMVNHWAGVLERSRAHQHFGSPGCPSCSAKTPLHNNESKTRLTGFGFQGRPRLPGKGSEFKSRAQPHPSKSGRNNSLKGSRSGIFLGFNYTQPSGRPKSQRPDILDEKIVVTSSASSSQPLWLQCVNSHTADRYWNAFRALLVFLGWSLTRWMRASARKIDAHLSSYIDYVFREKQQKQRAFDTLAAVLWMRPELKGALFYSSKSLTAIQILAPPKSWVPLPWPVVAAVAVLASHKGQTRFALSLIITVMMVWRGQDTRAVRACDIFLRDHWSVKSLGSRPIVILGGQPDHRGHRSKLKTKRHAGRKFQHTVVLYPVCEALLAVLKMNTSPTSRIFPMPAARCNTLLQHWCKMLRIDGHWVWHGLRHSGASLMAAQGFPTTDIIQQGRWAGSQSQRRYIESLSSQINAVDLEASTFSSVLCSPTFLARWPELISVPASWTVPDWAAAVLGWRQPSC